MKPYYEHGGITIYHGDCRELFRELPQFDCVLTDIPYGEVNRESSGLRELNKGCADVADFNLYDMALALVAHCSGSIYVWCGTEQVGTLRTVVRGQGLSGRLCIWEKTDPSPMNGQHLWLSSVECCVFGKRTGAVFNEFCCSPVFRGPSADSNGHPTPKPEWLMRRLLKASSRPGQTVLDPFCGSGTTLAAAKALGLKAVGIEQKEEWAEMCAKRLSQEVFDFEGVRG
jgi:DNA modification methylase